MQQVVLVVLSTAVASMVVYAALGRRRDKDADARGSRFLLGLGDFFVHWFLWVLSPAETLFRDLGLSPDFFNFAGLVFGLTSGILIGLGRLELGGWAIVLSGICDILDGRIARATKRVSPYGKFIDSTLDRFVEVFPFLGFVVYLRAAAVGPFLATSALAGSLLVSYAQSRGETLGVSGAGGLMQRSERVALTSLACLVDPTLTARLRWAPGTALICALAFLAVTTFATAIYRTAWISRRLRR